MNNQNFQKPITLVREEFIQNMVDLCNNSGLPFFVIEDAMTNLIQTIHIAAQQQLEEDMKNYKTIMGDKNMK